MNARTQLVCSAWKFEHITLLLRNLHWLWVLQRIEFNLSTLVSSSIVYMVQLHSIWHASCAVWQTLTHDGDCILHQHQHSTFHQIIASQSATMPSVLLPLVLNSLPPDITASPSLTSFKQRLKTQLFQCAFHCNVLLHNTGIFFPC